MSELNFEAIAREVILYNEKREKEYNPKDYPYFMEISGEHIICIREIENNDPQTYKFSLSQMDMNKHFIFFAVNKACDFIEMKIFSIEKIDSSFEVKTKAKGIKFDAAVNVKKEYSQKYAEHIFPVAKTFSAGHIDTLRKVRLIMDVESEKDNVLLKITKIPYEYIGCDVAQDGKSESAVSFTRPIN